MSAMSVPSGHEVCSALALNSNRLPYMSASLPTVDRRPISSVAIIGNDAVLAAAPATPVQLAHACLRRGFTVAVPASWGDELVAGEAVRRLATRARGPAVMCVCPFVRSRLLAPGPDLAPFLVSLVSPPVATARYLRAVYGDHGVHITYIGGCPSGADPIIDARLTPDAFLADIAEHGIALSEQPLVFDSIVPPDRRRWCSLPGGAPSAEILWSDTDTRTLVEIDRDDISTDLAQHIITREHVLLDLAPSLGCVCSGAVSSLPPRSARVAVTALEPPRALRPVIEVPSNVSIDAPVGPPPSSSPHVVDAPAIATGSEPEPPESSDSLELLALPEPPLELLVPSDGELMESRLDEMLGTQLSPPDVEVEREPASDPDFPSQIPTGVSNAMDSELELEPFVPLSSAEPTADSHGAGGWAASDAANRAQVVVQSTVLATSEIVAAPAANVASGAAAVESEPALAREPEVVRDVVAAEEPTPSRPTPATVSSPVRRRTPVPMPVRHAASSIPRATSSDGRALPRAYVAKRRSPSNGMTAVDEIPPPADNIVPRSAADGEAAPTTPRVALPVVTASPMTGLADRFPAPPALATTGIEAHRSPENAAASAASTAPNTSASNTRVETSIASPVEDAARPEPTRAGAAVKTAESNPSALIVLLVALLALGFFALRSLN